jgi:hypothetical protein
MTLLSSPRKLVARMSRAQARRNPGTAAPCGNAVPAFRFAHAGYERYAGYERSIKSKRREERAISAKPDRHALLR